MGCELRLQWLMTHVQHASGPRADRLQPGKQRAAFKSRFPVPKLNHFSQISSRLDWMALILLVSTQKQINHPVLCGKKHKAQNVHSNIAMWSQDMRGSHKVIFSFLSMSTLAQTNNRSWSHSIMLLIKGTFWRKMFQTGQIFTYRSRITSLTSV